MEKEINSIEEYFEIIFNVQNRIDEKNVWEGLVHTGIALRGQSDKKYDLLPSIGRNRQSSFDISILNQERTLIEMAKYKLPHVFGSGLSPIDLLALLQHYGIPTRLLDVTSNPLVALYFASLNSETDGEVIVFEYQDSDNVNYPIVNAVAESYKYAFVPMKPLYSFFNDVVLQPYFDEQRNYFCNDTNKDKEIWVRDCCKNLLFVNATEQLERQRMQHGFYIIFPNKISEWGNDLCFEKIIDPIDKENKQIIERIIIKGSAKVNICKKLEFLGVSEATLFADNIDTVCKSIVNQCKKCIG